MKKIIRLTESDLARIVKRVIQEGNIEKSSKEKDLDVKMENFRDKIKDFVKQVGTDFEVHCDGEHVGQVMFRRNAITVKKEGSRFGKDFKFNEMGDIKAELSKMLK
jgi:signal transduction histidine kinase